MPLVLGICHSYSEIFFISIMILLVVVCIALKIYLAEGLAVWRC